MNNGVQEMAGSRAEALEVWEAFLPRATHYAGLRNRVETGHPHVTRLSPAIRSRLVSEEELIRSLLDRHGLSGVEKLVQEILWRQYWKGWLELRPQVWREYRASVRRWQESGDAAVLARAEEVAQGRSGVAVMDRFARELMETGYLHNHARMWWASHWIHGERLPWELGADWFYRHLLDADPASNTLGWRWVAGIQTPGKAYRVRRSNLERYCDGEYLADETGLERLEDGALELAEVKETVDRTVQPLEALEESVVGLAGSYGIWIHGEDASVETTLMGGMTPAGVLGGVDRDLTREHGLGGGRLKYMERVLEDALGRASRHFACPVEDFGMGKGGEDLATGLVEGCRRRGWTSLVTMKPAVGPLRDQLPALRDALAQAGIGLRLCRRREDSELWPLARGGYFGFWESVRRRRFTDS